MLNLALGTSETLSDGSSWILTRKGPSGHALYGPYQRLVPGRYFAGFSIEAADRLPLWGNPLLAVIDISSDRGRKLLARQEVRSSDLSLGRQGFGVPFTVTEPCQAEYRVWVKGKVSLRIEDNRAAVPLNDIDPFDAQLRDASFPVEAGAKIPFFVEYQGHLRTLFDHGILVRIVDGSVRLTVGEINLQAHCADDLRFVGELFLENAYNFGMRQPSCVIDIGMNLGLATLHFASKPEVFEVHSFEPFTETFQRALGNISLNPLLQDKIKPYNLGLSDRDFDGSILVDQHGDSGAMTTTGVEGGVGVHISQRDAGRFLQPIIEKSVADGLEVIVKVDCEGSEFAVFDSLRREGLLGKVRAFLVEWHSLFDDKSGRNLMEPLREQGFLVIDRSPPIGNGFFYAVRIT